MLKITNVKKHFGGVKAVDGISFEIKKGKITALIGPNGSGKSTLFNLISGVYPLDEGNIYFKNEKLNEKKIEQISNLGISRIFQKSRMFDNLTVRENLILAIDNQNQKFWKNLFVNNVTKEKEEKVLDALTLVGIEKKIDSRGDELSFGQKRLVEIARAIIKPHELLMLDEPVAGVTPPLRKTIATLLLKLKKSGETILLIEHDMNFTLGIADRVIVLDEGQVIADDSSKKIKKNKKVLEAYLGG
ncbi:MAG: ABC transporter ATP-binding protein [archaeon]|jgi:branched-chain amino acid transport system ATP-binding protein